MKVRLWPKIICNWPKPVFFSWFNQTMTLKFISRICWWWFTWPNLPRPSSNWMRNSPQYLFTLWRNTRSCFPSRKFKKRCIGTSELYEVRFARCYSEEKVKEKYFAHLIPKQEKKSPFVPPIFCPCLIWRKKSQARFISEVIFYLWTNWRGSLSIPTLKKLKHRNTEKSCERTFETDPYFLRRPQGTVLPPLFGGSTFSCGRRVRKAILSVSQVSPLYSASIILSRSKYRVKRFHFHRYASEAVRDHRVGLQRGLMRLFSFASIISFYRLFPIWHQIS